MARKKANAAKFQVGDRLKDKARLRYKVIDVRETKYGTELIMRRYLVKGMSGKNLKEEKWIEEDALEKNSEKY